MTVDPTVADAGHTGASGGVEAPRPAASWYLATLGFPFTALLTADQARAMFEAVPERLRRGDMARGFEYVIEFPESRWLGLRTSLTPVADRDVPMVCRRHDLAVPDAFTAAAA